MKGITYKLAADVLAMMDIIPQIGGRIQIDTKIENDKHVVTFEPQDGLRDLLFRPVYGCVDCDICLLPNKGFEDDDDIKPLMTLKKSAAEGGGALVEKCKPAQPYGIFTL